MVHQHAVDGVFGALADAAPSEAAVGGVPDWLAQVAGVLLDGPAASEARSRMRRVRGELARLDGVPFSVVHDWHARTVSPLLVAASGARGGDVRAYQQVRSLHERALAGEPVAEAQWREALEPALREVYRHAFPREAAHATAAAAADSFARSRGWSEAEAAEYGETYAALNTGACARMHEEANASAHAAALAAAWAAADAAAYAATYPAAFVRGCVRATATDGTSQLLCLARLAGGLADALARAAPRPPA